jgi:hypothetical protein
MRPRFLAMMIGTAQVSLKAFLIHRFSLSPNKVGPRGTQMNIEVTYLKEEEGRQWVGIL